MPSERSAKSARVVPSVVVAMMVSQYSHALKRMARICASTNAMKTAAKIAVLTR